MPRDLGDMSPRFPTASAPDAWPPETHPWASGIPRPGDLVAGRYTVEHVIGVGGMGVVVAARHAHLGQRVAIKFMRGEATRSSGAAGRFLREARAVAALSSEHVAKVLDFGTLESGESYLVMEYLSGRDLAHILKQDGPMAIADAVGFTLQACEAIAEAHSLGIVHRDLKPANLFVSTQLGGLAVVKVLDFGISKIVALNSANPDESLTATGAMMGSPGYMSPEQVRDSKAVDTRSDIWSIGVILYELLTGISPFEGDTAGKVFARIITETPCSVRQLRSDVSDGLACAIAQCLERDLARRVPSICDLARLLRPFAPPEGQLSVDRIQRVANRPLSSLASRGDTLPTPALQSFPPPKGSGTGETGPAWLRSHAAAKRPGALQAWLLLAAVLGGIGIAALTGPFLRHDRLRSTTSRIDGQAESSVPANTAATSSANSNNSMTEPVAAAARTAGVADAHTESALDPPLPSSEDAVRRRDASSPPGGSLPSTTYKSKAYATSWESNENAPRERPEDTPGNALATVSQYSIAFCTELDRSRGGSFLEFVEVEEAAKAFAPADRTPRVRERMSGKRNDVAKAMVTPFGAMTARRTHPPFDTDDPRLAELRAAAFLLDRTNRSQRDGLRERSAELGGHDRRRPLLSNVTGTVRLWRRRYSRAYRISAQWYSSRVGHHFWVSRRNGGSSG